jgi:hypothetical protein
MSVLETGTALYNLATHSMQKIEKAFDPETGQVRVDDTGEPKIREVVDWPVGAGLNGEKEWINFFKWAEQLNNYHPDIMNISHDKVPKGYHSLRYQTKAFDERTNSLSVFAEEEREFLENYVFLRDRSLSFKVEDLFTSMGNSDSRDEALRILLNFKLDPDNETVCCPEASNLHILIPYLKRLVRLFPHIAQNVKDQL